MHQEKAAKKNKKIVYELMQIRQERGRRCGNESFLSPLYAGANSRDLAHARHSPSACYGQHQKKLRKFESLVRPMTLDATYL
jgi:hypothetical protein